MKQNHYSNRSAHQEASKLLPWYVNQTLSGQEREFVAEHLKTCLMCRIELTNQQKLSVSVKQSDPFTSAAQASFMQLQKRIHQASDQRHTKKAAKIGYFIYTYQLFKSHIAQSFVFHHPIVAFSVALLFSFVLLIPGTIDIRQTLQNVEFRTLSSNKHISSEKNEIRVVFTNETKPLQINRILAKINGRIISGPTAQGVFTIRIEKQEIVTQDIMNIIALLRNNVHILFAEPAYTLLSPNNHESG